MLSDYCIDGVDPNNVSQDVVALNLDEPMPPKEVVDQLTEVFFSTFNIMLPIIDKTKYMAMMRSAPEKQPRAFLQYAIMATAAAGLPRFRRLKTILYSRARKYLHRAENFRRMNGAASVGFIQAICLIAHLECREGLLPQAWISVGKAHRAVSMLLLSYIDGAAYADQTVLDTAETAELRRAFWFVFLCDRLGSLATTINGLIDLSDVVTRVPMDDEAFLSGNYNTDTCRIEDLMREPALFSRYPNSRFAYLLTLAECGYHALELGRFPRKQFMNAPKEWMAEYKKCDSSLVALRAQMPVVPPVPTAPPEGADPRAFVRYQEQKSRRISYILINILAQAGMLGVCRTGLYGIQAMPVLLPLMYPAKLLQQAMMSMLEILLISRNPHDLSAIAAHPLHPICLFVVSALLLALSDYELVSLQNFQAPLAYMIETLRELKDDMPLSTMLSAFLVNAVAPQKQDSVKRVEEVLVARRVNLTLPNFFEKWTEVDEVTEMLQKSALELSQNEISPSVTDDNSPSVAGSIVSPDSESIFTPYARPPSVYSQNQSHYASSQYSPQQESQRRNSSASNGKRSTDAGAGIYVKSEQVLSMDFESALEMSRALDEREGAHEETVQAALVDRNRDDALDSGLIYRNPGSAPKSRSGQSPLDANPSRHQGKHDLDSHLIPVVEPGLVDAVNTHDMDVTADQLFGQLHQDTFQHIDTGMFDDPPDIFPDNVNVDLATDYSLFTHPVGSSLDGDDSSGDRWFDQSPNSYQQVAWP